MAMEDFRVDVIVGKGPGATAIPLELPPFTLVGATTRSGLLPAPLRDRFGFTAHMEFYEAVDLEQVVNRSARLLGRADRHRGRAEMAGRSRGTPRIANRLLRRVRDYAEVRADGAVDLDDRPGRPGRLRGGRARPGPAGPRGAARPAASCSAAARWGCPRWPSRSARSPRRSRRSPSRSWSARACWRARRGAGSRPPRRGRISGSAHREPVNAVNTHSISDISRELVAHHREHRPHQPSAGDAALGVHKFRMISTTLGHGNRP